MRPRYGKSVYFLVMTRPAWDFSQPLVNDPPIWGTSFLELPEFYNVTILLPDGRAWPWQVHAVPYPTSFHPPNLACFKAWVQRVKRSRRTSLIIFAGGGGIGATPNIRRSIRKECDNGNSSMSRNTTNSSERDTPTRRLTFDAITAGCIPVFFEELSAKMQYQWHLPEDKYPEFSVFIPKEEVVFKRLKILDVLMVIPRSEVRKMRESIVELIPI
ncbi:xyloglucan galactosyltransferase KATAMARI1-like protein isoform 2 [Hibiscus syriacus]|uniref:Xyloglucan galactosyltransferase KATAMARI1-like protein isoform 2 n=1 Tax=Hibiscus syriacus TaxID=106335 RepID=A0A6A3BXY6_HIBSY|nr:xyloglucan galactosyltransferase KATAMARI1-like protein isoform 2 [Hibiscus syriacus]